MTYKMLIDPDSAVEPALDGIPFREGDRRALPVYVYDDRTKLALNVALATGRPLLISGEPGTGKSSLAEHLRSRFGWRLYSQAISSRTQAKDLQWRFDTVRRLSDAQTDSLGPPAAYLQPGVLWWAFDAKTAARRGLSETALVELKVPRAVDPCAGNKSSRAIVLLDEIDKADPDVPNDLLEPLATFRFRVEEPETDLMVEAETVPLVLITTNEERDLPRAFVRRCVSLRLDPPDKAKLELIAGKHFPTGSKSLHTKIAERFLELRTRSAKERMRPPSTAEYLDAISACTALGITPDALDWNQLASLTLVKPQGTSDR